MIRDRNFDPRLVLDANRSLGWIFESFKTFRQDPTQPIGKLLAPYIRGDQCDLINPGLVLAASYIYFVYPREATLELIDITGIDVSSFRLSQAATPREILRRLRNSLSHGRFSIDDSGTFTFDDDNRTGTDPFSARVHFADLGSFVESFGRRVVEQLARGVGAPSH